MKQGQDRQMRVMLKCLQNMLNREEDEKEKDRIVGVMRRLERTRDKKQLNALNPVQSKMYILLSEGFLAYKEAFVELIHTEKYKTINQTPGFEINDCLINLQNSINLNKDALTIDSIVAKYTVNILKLKKQYENWSKDIVSDWSNKSKQKMKRMELKRVQIKKKIEEKNDKFSQSEENESEEQKPKAPPPPPAPVYRPEPERRPMTEKPRKVEPREQRNEPRGMESTKDAYRCKLMEKYLENRKDIHIQKGKLKEVAESLNSKMDNFMRKTVERILDIAALKNKKNPKLGNQVGYFHPQNQRLTAQTPFYLSPNSKIFMLQYKHKLQIYTTLRAKQIKKEDELRNALQANTSETEKKVDKKIQSYILKPRPKQVEPIQIYKQDKDTGKGNISNMLISAEHALYFLQNHRFLRNSLLLFNAYHY